MGAQNLADSHPPAIALQAAATLEAHPSMGREPTAPIGISHQVPVRVLIASDHALFRQWLRLFLAQQADLEVIGEAADGLQALHMVEALQPDILLLDVQKPRGGELEILVGLRTRSPRTNVLILSGIGEDAFLDEALQQGARGFLLETATQHDFIKAIHTTYAGELWVQRKVLTAVLEHMRQKIRELQGLPVELPETLTEREREIVNLVLQGMMNKEIATQLGISEKTAKAHLRNIFPKLKISRRAQLVCAPRRVPGLIPATLSVSPAAPLA